MVKSYKNFSKEENDIVALYTNLINSWNNRDGIIFAKLFNVDGNIIGFDGGQLNGQSEIEMSMLQIFSHLQTASYVAIVRDVRFITSEVALLRSSVGMVPHNSKDINPGLNAIHSLVVSKEDNEWKINQFHITPAQYHAYPQLSQELSEELRSLL